MSSKIDLSLTRNTKMHLDNINKTGSLIKRIGVPPQPDIVVKLLKMINQENLDIQDVVDIVSRDVSLSAKTLKIANSPFFRKTKVDNIHQAICILGIRNFYTIILTASLEEALKVDKVILKKFWRHSKITALSCSLIAREIGFSSETAYLAGLFHDVGIALMLDRYPDYLEIEDYALYPLDISRLTDKYETVTGYESGIYNTNHAVLAYAMAQSWGLADTVCQVIINHHRIQKVIQNTKEDILFNILRISEALAYKYEFDESNKGDSVKAEASHVLDKINIQNIYQKLKDMADESPI
ncbi:MAG: HDOD domain-containing protein [Thermodesulfovibrionales bacterium]